MNDKNFTVEELETMLSEKKAERKQKEKAEIKKIKLKKKLGFSEKLVLWILVLSWISIILGIVYAFIFQANEVWTDILDVVKYLAPATIGFFIWKARGENIVRIKDNPDFNLQEYAQDLWDNFIEESGEWRNE